MRHLPFSKYYSRLKLKHKLQFITLLTSFIAALISIFLVLIYQYYNEKVIIEKETKATVKVLTGNIAPSFLFKDEKSIEHTMNSLNYQNKIKTAFLLDPTLSLFKSYNYYKDSSSVNANYDKKLFSKNHWDNMTYFFTEAIYVDKEIIGYISVESSLKEFYIQTVKETFVIFFIIFSAIFVIYKYSNIFDKSIVRPLSRLSKSTRDIIHTQSLDVELPIYNHDEIGELTMNFNEMISALKEADKNLRQSNNELEYRVEERTVELMKLNDELDDRVKQEVEKSSQQQEILIQQSRSAAMGEMIGNIAHQWRQPLNALSLVIQNIETAYEMDILDENYIKRTIEKCTQLSGSMSQTINDFQSFFKPNKAVETFSIIDVLQVAMRIVEASLINNDINFNQEIEDALEINGYINEFSQVLLNIFGNAKDVLLENVTKNRTITFKAYKEDAYIYVVIEDNAGGIKPEIIEKIFDPYFTTKEEGKGTGIGLYMSKTIIEKSMKGTLSVKNSLQGAQFIIKLKALQTS